MDLGDFRRAADAIWSTETRAMIEEGAGAGRAIRANRAAFESWALRPRVLVDVSSIETSARVLGREVSLPVLIAPSGLHEMSHSEGELATARAAANADTVMVLSSATSRSMMEVRAAAGSAATWFQLYWGAERERTLRLIRMAEEQGCSALTVTLDMPVRPTAGEAMRVGIESTGGYRPLYVLPRTAHLSRGEWDHDPRLTWADLTWLKSVTSLPLVLKGIMSSEDATLAVSHGADAIIVSNHGGRSLDTARGTLDALPEIADAVAGAIEIYLDGGVRRGHDIVVARALGARAVLIGRPIVWGLAAGGAEGASAVLSILRDELASAMGMIGAPTVNDITRNHLTPATSTW